MDIYNTPLSKKDFNQFDYNTSLLKETLLAYYIRI